MAKKNKVVAEVIEEKLENQVEKVEVAVEPKKQVVRPPRRQK